jgi:hypothetical protein
MTMETGCSSEFECNMETASHRTDYEGLICLSTENGDYILPN